LRAELATLVNDFSPLINELWPRLEDHKYRRELHSYGLPEGYDKLIVADSVFDVTTVMASPPLTHPIAARDRRV
jgi:hypothetical protein